MNCNKCSYAKDGNSNPNSSVCEQCMKTHKFKLNATPMGRYNKNDGHEEVVIDNDDER